MKELPVPDNVIRFPHKPIPVWLEVDEENPNGEGRGSVTNPDELLAREEPISIEVYRYYRGLDTDRTR
jgi:hypothetical protein